MSTAPKPSPVVRRIQRAGGLRARQERHSPCIICGKNFDDCPHSLVQVDDVLLAYRLREAGKLLG